MILVSTMKNNKESWVSHSKNLFWVWASLTYTYTESTCRGRQVFWVNSYLEGKWSKFRRGVRRKNQPPLGQTWKLWHTGRPLTASKSTGWESQTEKEHRGKQVNIVSNMTCQIWQVQRRQLSKQISKWPPYSQFRLRFFSFFKRASFSFLRSLVTVLVCCFSISQVLSLSPLSLPPSSVCLFLAVLSGVRWRHKGDFHSHS